ncbi:MAG: hypothetical protein JXR70_02750 [Spirochaetales bacterium]|nr:hypothetical protein [Spirochaetales bacterium]
MKRSLLIAISLVLILAFNVFGASDTAGHDITLQVLEVVLIDMNSTALITLSTSAPTNGGEDPTGQSDNSKLLQYTSLVASGTSRNITISMVGSAPAGTSLSAEAVSVPANCGTAAGAAIVGGTAANLITGIPSCATGTGANGAAITYTLNVDTVTSLNVGDSSTVTVTFTLADAS